MAPMWKTRQIKTESNVIFLTTVAERQQRTGKPNTHTHTVTKMNNDCEDTKKKHDQNKIIYFFETISFLKNLKKKKKETGVLF